MNLGSCVRIHIFLWLVLSTYCHVQIHGKHWFLCFFIMLFIFFRCSLTLSDCCLCFLWFSLNCARTYDLRSHVCIHFVFIDLPIDLFNYWITYTLIYILIYLLACVFVYLFIYLLPHFLMYLLFFFLKKNIVYLLNSLYIYLIP